MTDLYIFPLIYLEGLREEGLPIPEPTTLCEYVEAR